MQIFAVIKVSLYRYLASYCSNDYPSSLMLCHCARPLQYVQHDGGYGGTLTTWFSQVNFANENQTY